MKNRRFMSILLVCSMLIIMPAPAVSYGASFSDTVGHWAESYINQAVEKGVVQGYPEGVFMPDKSVSRAEFVTMINKALRNNATENITFADVPYAEWFYQDVSKAVAATYVGGYEDNTFKPNSPITRQEAAVIISRVVPTYGSSGNINAFPDRSSVADWAYTAMQKVNGKGYMGAYDDGNLHPLDELTRAQTAKIICDILNKETIVASDPSVRTDRSSLTNTVYSNGVTVHRDLVNGSATIENCVILGNLTVQGGGNDTVTVSNSRVAHCTVEKSSDSVRLSAQGETVISTLTAAKTAAIQTRNLTGGLYGSGINSLSILSSSDITLEGNFPRVAVSGSAAKLKLSSGTITNLTVSSGASKSDVTVESAASVNNAEVGAESYFHGTGTISRMNANANGITYEKAPSSVSTGSGYNTPSLVDPEGDIKFSPANGATKVSLSSKITITFNSAMTLYNGRAITSSNIQDFVILREGSTSGDRLGYTASINSAKTVITITPDANLLDNARYYLTIARNELADADGDGNQAQSISFSTGTVSEFVTFSPSNNSTGAAESVRPSITFSEAIEAYDGRTSLSNSYFREKVIVFKEDSSRGSNVAFSASYNSSSRVLTITPNNSLYDGQKYYLSINTGTVRTVKNGTNITDSVTWTVGGSSNSLSSTSFTSTETSVDVKTTANAAGRVYAVLLPQSYSRPSASQVYNGKDASGRDAAASTNKSVGRNEAVTLSFTGLERNTPYTCYMILRVGLSNSAVASLNVSTGVSYSISLSPSSHTFPALESGYSAINPLPVTVTNTGTQRTGALNIRLSDNSSAFTLSKDSTSDIAISGNDTFTVVPKSGLAAGTYTANVSVSGGNVVTQSLTVNFTVNAPQSTSPTAITISPEHLPALAALADK